MKKKILIIGGGIAGLCAGIYAQQTGFDSVIYEKHSISGGQCTGWNRNGYHIDGCVHWLSGTAPNTDMYRMWKNVGAFAPDVKLIQHDDFGTYELCGAKITLYKDVDRFRSQLIELSPEDKAPIDDFVKCVKTLQGMAMPAAKADDLMSIGESLKMLPFAKALTVIAKYGKMNCRQYADRFKHPALKKLFRSSMPDYAATAFMFSYATFSSGNGAFPQGGSLAMAKRIEERYISLGGSLRLSTPVDSIIVKDDTAVGIKLENGETVNGDHVIAACDAEFFFNKLLGGNYNDPFFESRFADPQNFPLPTSVLVGMGVEADLSKYPRQLIFDVEPYTIAKTDFDTAGYTNYFYAPEFAPEGCTMVEQNFKQEGKDYDWWKALSADKAAYTAEKQRIGELSVSMFEKRFPELSGKVRLLDVTTPLTYERYCNSYKGAWMSFMPTTKGMGSSFKGRIKNLKNCWLTGQWLQPPGGLPVAATTGKFTVQYIAKQEGLPIVTD